MCKTISLTSIKSPGHTKTCQSIQAMGEGVPEIIISWVFFLNCFDLPSISILLKIYQVSFSQHKVCQCHPPPLPASNRSNPKDLALCIALANSEAPYPSNPTSHKRNRQKIHPNIPSVFRNQSLFHLMPLNTSKSENKKNPIVFDCLPNDTRLHVMCLPSDV